MRGIEDVNFEELCGKNALISRDPKALEGLKYESIERFGELYVAVLKDEDFAKLGLPKGVPALLEGGEFYLLEECYDFCEGRFSCGELSVKGVCNVLATDSTPFIMTDLKGLVEIDKALPKQPTKVYRVKMKGFSVFLVGVMDQGLREFWRQFGRGLEYGSVYLFTEGNLTQVNRESFCAGLLASSAHFAEASNLDSDSES